MANVFEHGALVLVTPFNGADPLYYFGMEVAYNPPEQNLQRWGWIGQHGMNLKRLGTGGRSGLVNGFLDAESSAQLMTGTAYLEQKAKDATPETAVWSGQSIGNCLITRVEWLKTWNYMQGDVERSCASFSLHWEAP
jgi:hypothetical protein